jgi:hypothetical protein
MTNILEQIKRWLERKLNGPTINETVQRLREEHTRTVQHSVNTIYSHAFQEHMARSQLKALEAWEAQQPEEILSQAYRPAILSRLEGSQGS